MALDLQSIQFLTSTRGIALLHRLQAEDLSESNMLSLIERLRKSYTAQESSAALSMARLRQQAVAKFGADAQRMFFTESALQQASDPLIRQYRTRNVQDVRVLDVGCGIGSDGLAFARGGAHVSGIDLDPVRVEMARLNADALALTADFAVRDATRGIPIGYDLIFFDPARRDARGKRIYDVNRYIPPLALIEDWQADRIVVKLSPGVDLAQVRRYGHITFISVAGSLKEALLEVGSEGTLRAVRLEHNASYMWQREGLEPNVPIREPQDWLCEPDPALIRAGLVRDLVAACDGALLDEQIAYFTLAQPPDGSPWFRAWRIIAWMPYHLKRLRAYLRERSIGTVTVKKRGSPIEPDDLIRRLKLKGTQSATLVLTRYQDAPIVLICEDINA